MTDTAGKNEMMTDQQFYEAISKLGFQVVEWSHDLFKRHKACSVSLRSPQVSIIGDTWEDVLLIISRPMAVQAGMFHGSCYVCQNPDRGQLIQFAGTNHYVCPEHVAAAREKANDAVRKETAIAYCPACGQPSMCRRENGLMYCSSGCTGEDMANAVEARRIADEISDAVWYGRGIVRFGPASPETAKIAREIAEKYVPNQAMALPRTYAIQSIGAEAVCCVCNATNRGQLGRIEGTDNYACLKHAEPQDVEVLGPTLPEPTYEPLKESE